MSQTGTPEITRTQAKLENRYNKPIKQILIDELEAHRYQRNMLMLIATKLLISQYTFSTWCKQLDIEIDDYRYAPAG